MLALIKYLVISIVMYILKFVSNLTNILVVTTVEPRYVANEISKYFPPTSSPT